MFFFRQNRVSINGIQLTFKHTVKAFQYHLQSSIGKTYLKANRLPAIDEEISAGETSRRARNKKFRSETCESLIGPYRRPVTNS